MKQLFYFVISLYALCGYSQFGPAHLIDFAGSSSSLRQTIKTADINNDGLTDIIVSKRTSVSVYVNQGGLIFAPPSNIAGTWLDIGSMNSADLNNDGSPDIVSIDRQAGKLFWHPNTDGAFPSQELISEGLEPISGRILSADFNMDGNTDIVILNHVNALIYFNDGSGSFSPAERIIPEADETEIYDTVTGDFNNDGFPDIAISSGGFVIYLNDGAGHFTFSPGAGIAISFLLESADYDADGFDDILMQGLTLQQYRNTVPGFTPHNTFSPNNRNYQSLFSADLDNDGDMDVLTEDNQSGLFLWFENDGTGLFAPEQMISSGGNFQSIYGVHAADLDNDGDMDVIRSSDNGEVAFHENMGQLSVTGFPKKSFIVYPNPASGLVTIEFEKGMITAEAYDSTGRKTMSLLGSGRIEFDSGVLRPGVYLLKLTSGYRVETKKIIVLPQ